jgi:dephospho-CoA kinase
VTTQERRWILGGGLASGKSAVRQTLAETGVVTIDADSVGHTVLEPDGPAFGGVAERWPAVLSKGHIDRRALAQIVFNDPGELAALEGITHPHIFDTIRDRVEGIQGPVVVEVPVLKPVFGPGWLRMVVDSRDDEKLRRAVGRGMEEADARARLAAQPSREKWLAVADLVVPNHGNLDDLKASVRLVVGRL